MTNCKFYAALVDVDVVNFVCPHGCLCERLYHVVALKYNISLLFVVLTVHVQHKQVIAQAADGDACQIGIVNPLFDFGVFNNDDCILGEKQLP